MKVKSAIGHRRLRSILAIVDLLLTLPPGATATAGVDIVGHAQIRDVGPDDGKGAGH
jgi:alcohol dehydrogenase class IV